MESNTLLAEKFREKFHRHFLQDDAKNPPLGVRLRGGKEPLPVVVRGRL